MKIAVAMDVMPYSLVKMYRHFRAHYSFHIPGHSNYTQGKEYIFSGHTA